MGGSTISPSLSANTYNGTSWSAAPDANSAAQSCGSSGIETSAIFFGGGPGYLTATQSFDGSTWTTESALGTGVGSLPTGPMTASSTNAFKVGGAESPGDTSSVEEFNKSINTVTGAAWASGGSLGTARDEAASSQNGTQDAALYFGGYDGSSKNLTEQYDGTSWTAKNTITTARYSGAGAGTTAAALYSGGYDGSFSGKVEEFDGTNWSEETDLSTARIEVGGCGTQTAALVYAGSEPAKSDKTEAYNGSSWTAGGTLSQARSNVAGGVGTSTAAICVGGNNPSPTFLTNTEEYGGSSWTAGGALITATNNMGGAGTATDAIIFGGGTPTRIATTMGYDGTAFSTRPSLATARKFVSGTGTSTAGVAFGGNGPSTYTTATEEFTGETSVATGSTLTTS